MRAGLAQAAAQSRKPSAVGTPPPPGPPPAAAAASSADELARHPVEASTIGAGAWPRCCAPQDTATLLTCARMESNEVVLRTISGAAPNGPGM